MRTRAADQLKKESALSAKALNRATLARQHLLERSTRPALEAVEHLVGLQAQEPLNPYFGLWSRLEAFDPEELAKPILRRRAVRVALMRSTIHLVSGRDCLRLRPLFTSFLERSLFGSAWGRLLAGVDADAVAAEGRRILDEEPRTLSQLGKLLAERWPEHDPAALSYLIRNTVPLVQIPPRGVWGRSGQTVCATAETWLRRPLDGGGTLDELVLRYLGAFGPAAKQDVRAWCGLPGLGDVVERLRPRLVTFRDARGRELFDLPDAPRPHPDTPAPPRFLPDFDNVLLGHADRTRLFVGDLQRRIGIGKPTVLADGVVAAIWKLARTRGAATLRIEPFGRLRKTDREAVVEEGERLLAFAAPDEAAGSVEFVT